MPATLSERLKESPEIYQHIIASSLQGCEGVNNLSDDIIVYGENRAQHDERLKAVLERIKNTGLTLNKAKCEFGIERLVFMGHVFSNMGVAPEQKKIEAVMKAKTPTSPAEVRSFLGLVNYCARFIPDLSTVSEPMRRLTRSNVNWIWGDEQQNSFNELKRRLSSAEVMAYYSCEAETRIIVDASPVGLGAILSQRQKDGNYRPIAYASRSLTDVEKRYSQTEKEALAVVWGCKRFQMYLHGLHFELVTDHKPLEVIYSRKSKPPARIERWVLRLQPYDFKITYKPGSQNAADALSRLPQILESRQSVNIAEEYIGYVTVNAVPKAFELHDIREATEQDSELQVLRRYLRKNTDRCRGPYQTHINELSKYEGIILKGTRIVIPKSLRMRTLKLAHESHQGIVKTKQLMREKVWWPNLNKDIEELVSGCRACQVVSDVKPQPEPIIPTKLPGGPWESLAIDLCGPLPTGETLLVLTDYYSRWPEVAILRHTSANSIIKILEQIFSRHGLPLKITSDNGPQFISSEFKNFVSENAIQHRRTTPYWPAANGNVERMNRVLLKAIKAYRLEKKDWKREIQKFLLAYRTTPHSVTGQTPAELLMKRKLRTKIPEVKEEKRCAQNEVDEEVRDRDFKMKQRGKMYADKRRRARQSDIQIGDYVLLRGKHSDKFSTNFLQEPYRVVNRNGSAVTVENSNHRITSLRCPSLNSSFMKRLCT